MGTIRARQTHRHVAEAAAGRASRGQDVTLDHLFLSLVPRDFNFQAKLQKIEGMKAFAFGARAHQEFSDGEMISNDGSQSVNG